MLRLVPHDEGDNDLFVKSIDLLVFEVRTDSECQTVGGCGHRLAISDKIACPAVIVRLLGSDLLPSAVVCLTIERDVYTCRGPADRDI